MKSSPLALHYNTGEPFHPTYSFSVSKIGAYMTHNATLSPSDITGATKGFILLYSLSDALLCQTGAVSL